MRQIVGIGETIIDIIFRDNRPVSANAGGSTFNTFISLGRMHMNAFFVSQVGNDRLGRMACDFLRANNISASTKLLPPNVVRYLCEKYDIEL